MVIDNLPGAGGITGGSALVKATPDGLTIGMVSNNHVINPSVYKKLPYDTVADFTPITIKGATPFVLVVNPAKVAEKNVKDLIALLKAKPDGYNYASSGNGTVIHLAGEMFVDEAQVVIRHIPYKSTGAMVTDLIGGQMKLGVVALPAAQAHLKSGALRAVGLCGKTRTPAAPDIPTIAEQGLPNYDTEDWFAVLDPAKLPAEQVKRLHDAFVVAFTSPEVNATMAKQGNVINLSTPEAAALYLSSEMARYAVLAKKAGISLDSIQYRFTAVPADNERMDKFTITNIPEAAREDTEQLGSKPKFWVLLNGRRWLFKEARPHTGEDWAEKIAAEIAHAIGINAATVELAAFAGKAGCISLNFIDVEAGEALVHGNEIMAWQVTGYDKEKIFQQSDHTLENIQQAVRGLSDWAPTDTLLTELAGYMVLDALIGNTDRHHENWGLRLHRPTVAQNRSLSLAPSFDHASSLGRELLDTRRSEILASHGVARYVGKGRGGIFRDAQQPHGANPLRLVQVAARAYPYYFSPALERVAGLDTQWLQVMLAALPNERASETAKQFAYEMTVFARTSLIELLK